MKRLPVALLALACSGGGSTRMTSTGGGGGGTGTPSLIWSDEFDGPAGTTFDHTKWTADTGGNGFGNQEREYYTTDTANVTLDGNGHLVITARVDSGHTCWYGPCRYTSARLKTQGLFAGTYGRFEARIRITRGQGLWPAWWMLGTNIASVGWPQCGEIDIMENIGREPTIIHGTAHGPGYSGASGIGAPYALPQGGTFADDFHVYAVSWQPNLIEWSVDGHVYHGMTPTILPRGTQWVFNQPFFVLLNVAVGGAWPGDPDSTTTFPQQMVVDYVRVYNYPGGR